MTDSTGTQHDDLLVIIRRLMADDFADESAFQAALQHFERSVPMPGAADLIFHCDRYFATTPTPREILSRALSYRPLELS